MSSSGGKFVSADCALNATVQTGVQFIYFIIRAFKVGEIPGGWGTSLEEANGDVPLDGVAFSRLE